MLCAHVHVSLQGSTLQTAAEAALRLSSLQYRTLRSSDTGQQHRSFASDKAYFDHFNLVPAVVWLCRCWGNTAVLVRADALMECVQDSGDVLIEDGTEVVPAEAARPSVFVFNHGTSLAAQDTVRVP